MSWQKARREAETWIESLKLGKVRGKAVDLSAHGGSLAAEGAYRAMILQAAGRLLAARGAKDVILPL